MAWVDTLLPLPTEPQWFPVPALVPTETMQLPTIDETTLVDSLFTGNGQVPATRDAQPAKEPESANAEYERIFGQLLTQQIDSVPAENGFEIGFNDNVQTSVIDPSQRLTEPAFAVESASGVDSTNNELVPTPVPPSTGIENSENLPVTELPLKSEASFDGLMEKPQTAPFLAATHSAEGVNEAPENPATARIDVIESHQPVAELNQNASPRISLTASQEGPQISVLGDSQSTQHEFSDAPDRQGQEKPSDVHSPVSSDSSATAFNSFEVKASETISESSPVIESDSAKPVSAPDALPVTRISSGYQLDVEPPGIDGKVVVVVRQSAQGVEAHLEAPGEEAHRLLHNSLSAIREHLESAGVDLGGLSLGFHEEGFGSENMDGHPNQTTSENQSIEHATLLDDQQNKRDENSTMHISTSQWDGQLNVLA